MKNILYVICFCAVGFTMWLSIGFSFIEKICDKDVIFNSWEKIIATFFVAIVFSGLMTFLSYLIVGVL